MEFPKAFYIRIIYYPKKGESNGKEKEHEMRIWFAQGLQAHYERMMLSIR